MVGDSADNVFDRLKGVVKKRAPDEADDSFAPLPDLIIEDNPIVIGEDKAKENKKKPKKEEPKKKKAPEKDVLEEVYGKKLESFSLKDFEMSFKKEKKKELPKQETKKSLPSRPLKLSEEDEIEKEIKQPIYPAKKQVFTPRTKEPEEDIDAEIEKEISAPEPVPSAEKLHATVFSNFAQKLGEKKPMLQKHEAQAIERTKETTARDIMTPSYGSIEISRNIADALKMMEQKSADELLITQNTKAVGTLSRDKITQYFKSKSPSQQPTIQNILSSIGNMELSKLTRPNPLFIESGENLQQAMKKIEQSGVDSAFVVSNGVPIGTINKKSISQLFLKHSFQHEVNEDIIETGLDKLLALIEKENKISTDKASKLLGIKREIIEEWGSILEDHNLIKIEYPLMGTIELVKKTTL